MDRTHVNIYHTSLVDLGVRYMKAVMAAVAMAEIHAVVVYVDNALPIIHELAPYAD